MSYIRCKLALLGPEAQEHMGDLSFVSFLVSASIEMFWEAEKGHLLLGGESAVGHLSDTA